MQKLSDTLTKFNNWLGHTVSWLTLFMVLTTFVIVVLRKFFDVGWIWLQESVTWMHAIVFMLAASYALNDDEHVRVDVFYTNFSARKKSLVNLLGAVFLLLPLCGFIVWSSRDYVTESWRIKEASWQSGGIAYLFLLKTVIPVTAILLALQGVTKTIANFLRIRAESN